MTIWVDAQMSPAIAAWVSSSFGVKTVAIRELGLREATDREIFQAAKRENVMVMTKDNDFVSLLDRFGPPRQVIWVTCGNTSNARLEEILMSALPKAMALLDSGEPLVEINAI